MEEGSPLGKPIEKWLAACLILVAVAALVVLFSPPVSGYISTVRQAGVLPVWQPKSTLDGQDELWKRLQEEARKIAEPPIPARIDPVWKAIPGYNGIEVDLEATYQLRLKNPDSKLYVLQEVPPDRDLDQLPPAPLYRANPQKNMVSFLINVAWGEEYLPAMLEVLRQENVRATFFLDGSWTEKHPELARRIAQEGHEIGNHAYNHPQMSRLEPQQMRWQIQTTNRIIQKTTGIQPRYFAPPGGDFNQQVVELAAQEGMKTILWTLDTIDWQRPTPETILKRILPHVENGYLILMHPTASTTQALQPMIRGIRQKGLLLGSLSDTISSKRTDIETPSQF